MNNPNARYMDWWKSDPKKPLDTHIIDGLAYYRQHHGEPSVILLPPMTAHEDKYNLPIRCDDMVQPNHVYIGHDGGQS